MNTLLKSIMMLFSMAVLCSCAGPQEFGPYFGKVVDAETNEPIEGAVVFVQYATELYIVAVGGPVSEFADADEVTTDDNGEFKIPRRKVSIFRIFHRWKPHGYGIVFKPGYGKYPDHEGTSRSYTKSEEAIPENTYVTIKLPKLKTKPERELNLNSVYYPNFLAPVEKQQKLIKAINIERTDLGFKPVGK